MMRKGRDFWRQLGAIEKTFLVLIVCYALAAADGRIPTVQAGIGIAAVLMGPLTLFQIARRGIRKTIWRLRNRVVAAYILIAVVPVVPILMLVGLAGYAGIGPMAVY